MIALLAVSLSIFFVNIIPDSEAMSVKATFETMSECRQVVTEDQVCVNKGDKGAYLYW
jgi:hypothetical protein